jgi:acyl-CoA dehydrogenase
MRADFLTVAVRTDPANKGANGVSLLLVEGDTPGLTRTLLAKMGWWASDTAHLRFDNCRVPVANLLGEEGAGLQGHHANFNNERLMMAAMAVAYAQVCTEEAPPGRASGAPSARRWSSARSSATSWWTW